MELFVFHCSFHVFHVTAAAKEIALYMQKIITINYAIIGTTNTKLINLIK